jgi:hypothetical protein
MLETSLTTSMVFIILIGAAMLTAAFRGFGGEEIVRNFLTGLPGGFWTQFIVVMAVIFVLGFFLDFIEIAIVVVPIVAPILLAETSANVTAVWLGVMIAVNMQTSFLTPPFGFSLFYLRGVAPKSIQTTEIWKGASVFIFLQLVGLGIVGYFPQLVNYLPLRSYYNSEVSPPPLNPKLQDCLVEYTYEKYNNNFDDSLILVNKIQSDDLSFIPQNYLSSLENSLEAIKMSKVLLEEIIESENKFNEFGKVYKPLHMEVRGIERKVRKQEKRIEKLKKDLRLETEENEIDMLNKEINKLIEDISQIKFTIPKNWESQNKNFNKIIENFNKTKLKYNRAVDNSFNDISDLIKKFERVDKLEELTFLFDEIIIDINKENSQIEEVLKNFEKRFNPFSGVSDIKKLIKKSRKILKKNPKEKIEAIKLINESKFKFDQEIKWRMNGKEILLANLIKLLDQGNETFALRKQDHLNKEQALYLASCKSKPQDISLYF